MIRTPMGNIPEEGDIVVVMDSNSIPTAFLGQYGKVTGHHFGKATVEFVARVSGRGGLSHTAYISDLKVVAEGVKE